MLAMTVGALFAQQGTEFEVASVRVHDAPLTRIMGLTISGTRVRLEGYSVFGLVMEAYRVKNFQVSLARVSRQESEIGEVYYDIDARTPGERSASRPELARMLQTLLMDRFRLAIHRETREMQVFALVEGKGGGRLKKSEGSGECAVRVQVSGNGRTYDEVFTNCKLDALVDQLGNLVSGPVVNQADLSGVYDFRIVATPGFLGRQGGEAEDIGVASALAGLGLKLERRKVAIEVIAVDHVERPSAN